MDVKLTSLSLSFWGAKKKTKKEMIMLTNMDYFSIGVYTTVFIYFIYMFFSYKQEKYNMYFSLGCLVAISRVIITYEFLENINGESLLYKLFSSGYFLSYIWGGVFLMLIAESLFKEERLKHMSKLLIITAIISSVFIAFADVSVLYYRAVFFDYILYIALIYANYIFIKAIIKKRKRAIILCIGNLIMCFGAVYDVFAGNSVFYSGVGEINSYTYIIYLIMFSYVLTQTTKEYQMSIFNSELNFLHAQIQPHFLFNTLNTIITYCRKDPNIAREMLMDLSTYLRGKFDYDSENMKISLKDEIKLIKSYLTIEKVRFGDRLEVVYDIDEDIDITVPCLIFQPLVENAVKHGLKGNIKGVKIDIVVRKTDDNIIMLVKDNGKGIDEDTRVKLLKQESSGVGINNTSKRLKLYYNTDLIIKSAKNEGTCITIKIPIGGAKC